MPARRPANSPDGASSKPFGIVRRISINHELNDIDPQAWLANLLARIADHPFQNLSRLLPSNWKPSPAKLAA